MDQQLHRVTDLAGRTRTGTVRVTLRPGFGVQVDGKHVEGGPHNLPLVIAHQLVESNRADVVDDEGDAPASDDITHGDPAATSRDPGVRRRGAR